MTVGIMIRVQNILPWEFSPRSLEQDTISFVIMSYLYPITGCWWNEIIYLAKCNLIFAVGIQRGMGFVLNHYVRLATKYKVNTGRGGFSWKLVGSVLS